MCASPLRGAAGPVRPGRIRIASVGVLLPIFSPYPFVIRAEAALSECFHRHWSAAASHGAPNEIGGDGFKCCRERAWGAKLRRENASLFASPRWGEADLRASRVRGLGCLSFQARYPLTPTLSPSGRGRKEAASRESPPPAKRWGGLGVGGALQHRPSTPGHFTNVKFAVPPHRKRGEGICFGLRVKRRLPCARPQPQRSRRS